MPETSAPARPSRRSVLAALGVAPLAVGGVLAATGATHAATDAPAAAGGVPDELRPGGEFDSYLAQLAAEDAFSGSVLLTHRGKPILERSHGWADKARGIANGPDTIFCLGSIPKTFTGVAIAKLAARDTVAFNAPVGTYLDGFPAAVAEQVTVHHLLTHTSGLGDYHSPEFVEESKNWHTVEEYWDGVLSFVRRLEPAFTPGTGSDYSNAGFVILGAIVAQVSSGSYYDYVREHVFTPAGMDSSDFYTRTEWSEGRRFAHPYAELKPGERVDVLDSYPLVGTPGGGAFATAPDLASFATALQDGETLLDDAHAYLITSPKVPQSTIDNGKFATYGTTAHLTNDQWSNAKNGGSMGVSCNVEWFPESRWVAVVLSNYADIGAPISNKARELIANAR